MTNRRAEVEAFFAAYAARFQAALDDERHEDLDGITSAFGPYFVGSSPAGIMGGANDDKFRAILPQGFAQYRAAGGKAMRIDKLEVSELDDLHVMAAVGWAFDYIRPNDGKAGTIGFTNRYFLSFADGTPKIFAYITPDEQQAMKDHGLL